MAAQRRRSSRFVCPDCGFKAAHAMGLGRHRSARHGVLSQRQQRDRAVPTGRSVSRTDFAKLRDRVTSLERDYERLLKSLSAAGRRRGRR